MLSNKTALRRWFFRALCLTPLMLILWWGVLVDFYLILLCYFADLSIPHLIPRGVESIKAVTDDAWIIWSGLDVVGKNPPQEFLFQLDKTRYLNRTVMGFPLLWALILATKRDFFGPIVAASLLQTVLCLLGIASYIFGVLAEALNPGDVLYVHIREAPGLALSGAEPYSDLTAFLAGVLFFGQNLTVPVIGPVLIWAVLCGDEIKRLLR